MNKKSLVLLAGILLVAAFALSACAGAAGAPGPEGPAGAAGPAGPAGPAGTSVSAADLSCAECHNDTNFLAGKIYAWKTSRHSDTGTAWILEAGNQTCAPCHSGASFIDRMNAGQDFVAYGTAKDVKLPDATPQNCRTCHKIHTTYSKDDFGLRSEAAVAMLLSKANFDGGKGNLCVNCHQARRYMANFPAKDAAGAVIPDKYTPSVRFNTHLSDQSDVMMGVLDINAILGVEGKPSVHMKVDDTCVGCHLGDGRNHTFKPQLSTCVKCHPDAKDTNVNGFREKFEEKYTELRNALVGKGLLAANADGTFAVVTKNADGSAVVLDPPQAAALFLYGALEEDASLGAHNPKYVDALIEAALAVLK